MSETTKTARCPSVHLWSGQRCIRPVGHEGVCWGKAQRSADTTTRAEWRSMYGVFKSHHQYVTIYPKSQRPPDTNGGGQ